MSAKLKAKKLVELFEDHIGQSDFHIPEYISGVYPSDDGYESVLSKETRELAKNCAVTCVQEIINFINIDVSYPAQQRYWLSVIDEIVKL